MLSYHNVSIANDGNAMRDFTLTDQSAKRGFTLIELSIVLVIIGLIVGGVLVGQDLIAAAQIRATISQIQKYDTAVNTFLGKYNGIPGDLQEGIAAANGFLAMSTAGTVGGVGFGDGNGLLEGGSAGAVIGKGETIVFWRHLTDAALIDGSYGITGHSLITTAGVPTGAVVNIAQSFPPAKLGRGNYFIAYAVNGYNYFQIQGVTGLSAAGVYTLANAMTPLEASAIDTKLDDGLPSSGDIQAMDGSGLANVAPTAGTQGAATTNCTATTTPVSYDTTTSGSTPSGNAPNCGLQVRFN